MSEQTVETAIETEFKPNADGNLEPQSMEDKFFGVKTEIPTNKDSEELKVEVVDDVPEEDRRPPKQEVQEEQSVDDDALLWKHGHNKILGSWGKTLHISK